MMQAPDLKSSDADSDTAATEQSNGAESTVSSSMRKEAPKTIMQGEESVSPPSESSTDYQPIPSEPSWIQFDSELERLCRIAAQVGGSQPAPISYTALIIAFLWAEGQISDWFREFVSSNSSIDTAAIYKSKNIKDTDREKYLVTASSGVLPSTHQLYSRSTRSLLEQAARIARDVARSDSAQIVLGTRHLMAAYALRNPSDHIDQVRGWGFDVERWRSQFQGFTSRFDQQFNEEWVRLGNAAISSFPIIGSFTADDPLAPPCDLLGIDDEAAAFARIAAAKSVQPPLAIGVFGEWGSGKTFFMHRIYDNVKALSDDATKRIESGTDPGPFLPDIVQIRFNAWHYIETNLWASLVEYIFTELDHWLQEKTRSSKSDAEQVFNRLTTAQQLKLDALDSMVSRRAERRSAEFRAERARREYEEALVRAAGVGAGTYARALIDTFLKQENVKNSVKQIGDALGAQQLEESSGRVLDVLEQARSEAGRSQLVMRAGIARLGTWPWIISAVVVLVSVPLLAVGVRDAASALLNLPWLKNVQETVLALSSVLAGAVVWAGMLLKHASGALMQIDKFDKQLCKLADNEVEVAKSGQAAAQKAATQDDVRKRKQALEAAERALVEAEVRLNEARSDFESASARNRLNAFIRAKAIDGDYAKHLGIIAAIRRDFGQLAALMGAANDNEEQRVESERLTNEVYARVVRFLDRLASEPDVRLTDGEARSLLNMLEPEKAVDLLAGRRQQFEQLLENTETLKQIETDLSATKNAPLPTLSRIILYIDDLDRCPPHVVVDVLQAVHLLLCFPLFTVVVAVDARWVSRALHEQFPRLLGETGPLTSTGAARVGAGASSHDYLEKIFQIPYWVRSVDHDSAQRYVRTLVETDVRRVAVTSEREGGGRTGKNVADTLSNNGRHSHVDEASVVPLQSSEATSFIGVSSTIPLTAAAVGLELTRWEAEGLERFAPLISATPRRLIRFVNLYRLLKTGLTSDARQRLVGEQGESDVYRTLIVQLAIVTGAPNIASHYFRCLNEMPVTDVVGVIHDRLVQDTAFENGRDAKVVLRVLASARDWPGATLSVENLLLTAPRVRQYSFTAWSD